MNTINLHPYEPDVSLNIPLAGRFLKNDYRNDRTTTVLDNGEQQVVINGRFLQTCYDGVFDA